MSALLARVACRGWGGLLGGGVVHGSVDGGVGDGDSTKHRQTLGLGGSLRGLGRRRRHDWLMLLRWVVGECLRRQRLQQGRTLREVADSAGVSMGHLSEVERGRKEPSSEVLAAICGALGMALEDLVEAMRQTLQRWHRLDAVAVVRDQVMLAA